MKVVVDTNILIDYLEGFDQARLELERHDVILMSPISWMEVMVGARTASEEQRARRFLRRFSLIPIDRNVSETAVALRRHEKLALPDAIIWAGAKVNDALLVTRNTKDFPADRHDVRVPYRL